MDCLDVTCLISSHQTESGWLEGSVPYSNLVPVMFEVWCISLLLVQDMGCQIHSDVSNLFTANTIQIMPGDLIKQLNPILTATTVQTNELQIDLELVEALHES